MKGYIKRLLRENLESHDIDSMLNQIKSNLDCDCCKYFDMDSLENYGACGGAIFNREKFIEIYNRLDEVPWDEINKLDTRPYEWCDATLSFLFQFFGFTSGGWEDWTQYESKNIGNCERNFTKYGWRL